MGLHLHTHSLAPQHNAGTMVYHLFHYQSEDCIEWPGPYLPKTQTKEGNWVNKPFHGNKWTVPTPLKTFFERTDVTFVGYNIAANITRLRQVCGKDTLPSSVKTIDITSLHTTQKYAQVRKDSGMNFTHSLSHTCTHPLLVHTHTHTHTHRSCPLDPTRD